MNETARFTFGSLGMAMDKKTGEGLAASPTGTNRNDLIDVFEDAWRGFILVPAQIILDTQNGDIAAMTLLNPYFESIEALHRGKSSEGKSQEFFIAGFLRVFEKISGLNHKLAAKNVAKAICKNARNGVAHTGFASHRVHFQRDNQNAFILTYPRLPNGKPDTESVHSILINAQRIHDAVNRHLSHYVKELRQPHKSILKDNFDYLMRSEWGIGKISNVVGITEEDFNNTR